MNLPALWIKVVIAVVVVTPVAYAENNNACTGLTSVLAQPRGKLPPVVLERIRAMTRKMELLSLPTGVDCAGFRIVIDRLANGKATGGKRLFGDQPSDLTAAQAELAQALQQSPDLGASLDSFRSVIADDQDRLIYEATLLQSKGLYKARDLRLQQFIEQVAGE
jgi:hypothetical protein